MSGRHLHRFPHRDGFFPRGDGCLASHRFPKLFSNRSVETFRLDRPALDVFPVETWNRLAAQRSRRGRSLELLAHGDPLGLPALRAALADHVSLARGVRCEPQQVVITSGTQHSLDLVARLLLDPGDPVWMEDPGYAPVTSLLHSHEARVVGIPVDSHGLDCTAGRLRCPLARLAYVTPACQFPLGVPMSHERRLQLLDWAAEAGAWIFEDDYDGLMRGDGRHQLALQSLDRTGCVIYSNSLNRMLFSSLRLGFLILPPAFIEPAAAALSITQRYQPQMDQATLADFITQGHFERHMQRMRELHSERHEALIAAAGAELGGLLQLLRFASRLAGHRLARRGHERSRRRGGEPPRATSTRSRSRVSRSSDQCLPALVFGLGAADPRAIRTAIRRLGRVLRVLAWQTKGARGIQNKVPAQNRPTSRSKHALVRAPRRAEPRSAGRARTQSQLAPMLSPRYR